MTILNERATIGALMVIVAMATLTLVRRAIANSAAFAYTMNWRHVDGAKNNKLHHLEAGALNIEGKLWIHEKRAKTSASPMAIRFTVFRDEVGRDPSVCTLLVTPSETPNERRAFSQSCGTVATGSYYVAVSKPDASAEDGDGWHNQGSGMLTTTN